MSQPGTVSESDLEESSHEIYVVFIDGETKTGKGAAGSAAAQALSSAGFNVYYDVAGDFYRRYVAQVRKVLGLSEDELLPEDDRLEKAANSAYQNKLGLNKDEDLGDLQRESISDSVSNLAVLGISQQFAKEWLALSIERARTSGAEVIVLDGRNLRNRLGEQDVSVRGSTITALDLYLTCDPETSARRTLLGRKIENPTPEQIAAETVMVKKRRNEDRNRVINPFIMPSDSVEYIPGQTTAQSVLQNSWDDHRGVNVPVSIMLDNTHISKPDMLAAVAELAVAAVKFKTEPALTR